MGRVILAGGKINMRPPCSVDANTILLLHGKDFYDSSPYGVAVTNNGVSVSAVQSKFGGSSLYFDGASYLSVDLKYSGDITVDFWVNAESGGTEYPTPFVWYDGSKRRNYIHVADGSIWFGQQESSYIEIEASPISKNEWHHIALVRKGTAMYGFIDGILVGTETVSYDSHDLLIIGVITNAKSSTWFKGYIDEFRVSNIARWAENFTPPTKPY